MFISKSLKPPSASNYLLVDKSHNLHLAIPLIGGGFIGTDNTCQTAKALKQFFGGDPEHTNTATHQLNEYKKQLELQLFFSQLDPAFLDENKRSIIQKQLKQIGLLLTGIENIKRKPEFGNLITGALPTLDDSTQDFLKTTNLCSISLRPFVLDNLGSPNNPLFSADRLQRATYGSSVTNIEAVIGNFRNNSLAKSLATKVKDFEYKNEANFITASNRDELFKNDFKKNTGIDCNQKIVAITGVADTDYLADLVIDEINDLDQQSKDFFNQNRTKINFVLDKIFSTLETVLVSKGIAKDDKEAKKIIDDLKTNESLKDIIKASWGVMGSFSDDTEIEEFGFAVLNVASESIDQSSFTPFYTDNVSKNHTTEEDAKSKMMLSIKLQFFLAQINIFLHDNKLLDEESGTIPDFGKILDGKQSLQRKFIAIISEQNFSEKTVEEKIFEFIEINRKRFKIKSNKTINIFGIPTIETFEFSKDQKDRIKELFTRNFNSIKGSPHYDNFWILREKPGGKVFSTGGNICVDFENLATHFQIQSHLIDTTGPGDYQPLTCQNKSIDPDNILDGSDNEFAEISDDVLFKKILEKLTELKRDSLQEALRFLKIKHGDKYFFEDKATELKEFLESNTTIKKALLLLANQEFKEDKVLLDKFLETINPQKKQIILTKDQLRALYTTFASDDQPIVYTNSGLYSFDNVTIVTIQEDDRFSGFETPSDITNILKLLLGNEYFQGHKARNHQYYRPLTRDEILRHASIARFVEGYEPPSNPPENPPQLEIDSLDITTSSTSAYISVDSDKHAELDKFLKHIIKLNQNKLYIPSGISINGEVRNAAKAIYEKANGLSNQWERDFDEYFGSLNPKPHYNIKSRYKLQRALSVCGIDLPLDNIEFSGNNGYTIKFNNAYEARRIEEIIYPQTVLKKSSSALIYQLVNHLCSPEISSQLNDLVNDTDFKKIRFALKALGINHFGDFDYNGRDGFKIRVDPKIKSFFEELNKIEFGCQLDTDLITFKREAEAKFSSNQVKIKEEFEKLSSLLIGFHEKCLFGEFDRSKFTADLMVRLLGQHNVEKKQEVIRINPLISCKYECGTPKPSNEEKIKVYCPTRILNSFKELLKEKKEILGSRIKNPYDDTLIDIPADHNDLTAFHLHILARNESFNCNGVMNVTLYKGLLTPNEIAELRCLVKASSLICFTEAKAYGGHLSLNINLPDAEKPVIIIDQSGLQWQGDHRNTGGLFFYPDNKNDPNLSGGDDGAKFSEWQNEMFKAMYQRTRPEVHGSNTMVVNWKGVEGKIDLDQLAFGIKEEFLQAFACAVNSSDLINDGKRIYFKFLKAGMGFFAEGIGSQNPNPVNSKKILKARLRGIILALEELKARMPQRTTTEEKEKIFKKVDVIEFPFSGSDGEDELVKIQELVKSLGLEYVAPTNDDALKRNSQYQNHIIATTNTGDPHALAGNEGGHQSVDASIATNLENSNCLNPLINKNFQEKEKHIESSQKSITTFEESALGSLTEYKKFTATINFQGIKYQDDRFSYTAKSTATASLITAGLTEAKTATQSIITDGSTIPAEFFLAVMQISSYNQGISSMNPGELNKQLKELLGENIPENYPDLARKFSAEFQKQMKLSDILTGRQETEKLNETGMRLFRASTDENIKNFYISLKAEQFNKSDFIGLLEKNYQKLSKFSPSKSQLPNSPALSRASSLYGVGFGVRVGARAGAGA